MTRTPDEWYERWTGELRVIRNDVLTVSLRQQVFEDLDAEIMRVNGSTSGAYVVLDQFLRPLYADGQTVLLRKIADPDRNSVSLQNLVREMRDNAHVLTRSRHHQAVRRGWQESGFTQGTDADCDELFDSIAGVGASCVPVGTLEALHDSLEGGLAGIRRHVNKQVAHRDRRDTPETTWGDVNRAIADLGALYSSVARLLVGATPGSTLYIGFQHRTALRGLFPLIDRGLPQT